MKALGLKSLIFQPHIKYGINLSDRLKLLVEYLHIS